MRGIVKRSFVFLGWGLLILGVIYLFVFALQEISDWQSDVLTFLRNNSPIIGAFLILGFLLTLWRLPKWQFGYLNLEPKERAELENEARRTLAQILGGALLLGGLYFTWATVNVTQESQITERFTRAIEQLGAVDEKGRKKLEVRLGGIYALGRIARDSEKDRWPVIEVLTAYVRENAPRKEETTPKEDNPPNKKRPTEQNQPSLKLATDIQAILTVLGRTRTSGEGENQRLDFRRTDLRGADLRGANLSKANFSGVDLRWANLHTADLSEADFSEMFLSPLGFDPDIYMRWGLSEVKFHGADLRGVDLREANLSKANLSGANLHGADLMDANLSGALLWMTNLSKANLNGANLSRADFMGTNLSEADLTGVDLRGVNLRKVSLTKEQIELAITDENTRLPDYLKKQAKPEAK